MRMNKIAFASAILMGALLGGACSSSTSSTPTEGKGGLTPNSSTSASTPAATTSTTGESTWDRYKPRTMSQIIRENSEAVSNTEGITSIFPGDYPSKIRMVYTGNSRPISVERKKHISDWATQYGIKPGFKEQFETELLFTENSVEYWMPVQSQVIPYFPQEVKKGEQVTLLTAWIGAIVNNGKADWIFLVNEFEH